MVGFLDSNPRLCMADFSSLGSILPVASVSKRLKASLSSSTSSSVSPGRSIFFLAGPLATTFPLVVIISQFNYNQPNSHCLLIPSSHPKNADFEDVQHTSYLFFSIIFPLWKIFSFFLNIIQNYISKQIIYFLASKYILGKLQPSPNNDYKLQYMIKDYYEILNIPRGASQAQISQSYRKLALRYNPKTTIQPPAVASHLFSQLGEAFEVLSDHVKRAFFDKYGYEKLKQGFYQGGNLIAGYRYAGNAEQIFNNFFKNQDALGEILDFSITKEGSLFGHAFGGLQNDSSFTCENLIVNVGCKLQQLYQGATKTITYKRKELNGDGRTSTISQQQKTINIKPGYQAGQLLHFPKQGHQTVHRTISDLYFHIVQLPHQRYTRNGSDLIYRHDLGLADAIDCKSVELVTLDGRHLTIAVDEIVTPQILQEVPGEGMFNESTGKKGSLFIRFNIKFPTNLSEGAKKQLRVLLAQK